MYSQVAHGFLYHTWAESLVEEGWTAVDPTFGQMSADATHLKLVEGESLADLTPIIGLMGQLKAQIERVETLDD